MYSMCLFESFCVFRKLTTVVVLSPSPCENWPCLQLMMMNAWPNGCTTPLRSDVSTSRLLFGWFLLVRMQWFAIRTAHSCCSRPSSLLYSETWVGWVMMLLLTSDHPWIMLLRTIPPHCNCCKHYQYQYHSMWPLMGVLRCLFVAPLFWETRHRPYVLRVHTPHEK